MEWTPPTDEERIERIHLLVERHDAQGLGPVDEQELRWLLTREYGRALPSKAELEDVVVLARDAIGLRELGELFRWWRAKRRNDHVAADMAA